jgi:hypothetical protein
MKKQVVHGLLLYCMLLFCCLHSRAQTEDARARDWITLQRLNALAGLDSSFLTAADKKKLQALRVDLSPIAVCTKPSSAPCGASVPSTSQLKLAGVRVNPDLVKLEWQIIAENNVEGFVLERRSLADTLRYDSVFYAKGQGNSLGKTKYGRVDQNPSTVETFYRVREIDSSGAFVYSNVVAIQGTVPALSVLVAPNPSTSSQAGFYVRGGTGTTLAFTVTNAHGVVILKKENLPFSGTNYISLSAFHLPPGFYTIAVISDKERSTRKMIIY